MRQGTQEEKPVVREKGGVSSGVLPRKKTRCVCAHTHEINMLYFKELIYITVRAIESVF